MTGDAEMQPVEGVDALDDLTEAFDSGDQPQRDAPEEEPEESDEEPEQEEPEEAEEEEEEAEDDPTIVIKHDGKDVELPLSEIKNLAQQGFDYSKKTMAVAEERKAVEQIKAEADHLRQQHEHTLHESIGRLQAFTKYMESQLGEPPSTELLNHDTASYILQERQWTARKGQLEQAQQAIQHMQAEAHRQRQAWIDQQANETEKALRDTLPGWNDTTLEELAGYAHSLGLNPQTVDVAFVQKGFWEALHKAKAYDAIQAKRAEMKPKAALTKVVKPSAANPVGKAADRAKREAAFNKNPSVDALADFLR